MTCEQTSRSSNCLTLHPTFLADVLSASGWAVDAAVVLGDVFTLEAAPESAEAFPDSLFTSSRGSYNVLHQ